MSPIEMHWRIFQTTISLDWSFFFILPSVVSHGQKYETDTLKHDSFSVLNIYLF